MSQTRVNPEFKLEDQGIKGAGAVYYNLLEPALIEHAIARGEGKLGRGGAFLVSTGKHTGRSPKDTFVVRTPGVEDSIWCLEPMDLFRSGAVAFEQPEALGELHVRWSGGDEEFEVQDEYDDTPKETPID